MTNKYAAALKWLRYAFRQEKLIGPRESIDAAIAVLEQAERWAGLIEAAGKVDKTNALGTIGILMYANREKPRRAPDVKKHLMAIKDLLYTLPEKPEGGKS
jgi:hypothetical protein